MSDKPSGGDEPPGYLPNAPSIYPDVSMTPAGAGALAGPVSAEMYSSKSIFSLADLSKF